MTEPLSSEDFREYTAGELAESLYTAGLPGEPAEVEVQDPSGKVIASGVVRLHVGHGEDFDRTGGYRWTKITARAEPDAAHSAGLPAGVAELLAELTGGVPGGLPGEPGDYMSVSRPEDSPDWERLQQVVRRVEAWKARAVPPEEAMAGLFDTYAASYLAVNRAIANIPERFTGRDRIAVTAGMANSWLEGFLYGVLFSQAGGHRKPDAGA